MDNFAQHRFDGSSAGMRVIVRTVALAIVLLALAPSVGRAQQPKRLPLAAQDMLEVEVQVRSASQLQLLRSMGLTCPGVGSCRLELSDPQVTALKEAGLEFSVLQRLVKLTLPAPGGGPESLQSVSQLNATDFPIPDYSGGIPGYAQSRLLISAAPAGATVESVQYQLLVQHTYPGDLQLGVSCDLPGPRGMYVWNQQGGTTDGGFDDDPEDDDDIYLQRSEFDEFDGSPVNQTWYLEAWDHAAGDTGWIDFFEMRIYFCVDPAAPTPLSPASQSRTCDTTPDFDWSDVSGAVEYRLQVDDNVSFASPEIDTTSLGSSYTPTTALTPGEYHWRVRTSDECGHSTWSSILVFDIDSAPVAPTLFMPSDGSQTCEGMPTFQWAAVAAASSYRIQIDNDPSFASPEDDATTASPHYAPASSLMPGTWYWRVRGSNSCGNSPWSAAWSVTIGLAPDPPALFTPMDGSVICDTTPDFEWDVAIGAVSYRIQVDDDAAFASPEITGTTTELHYTAPSPLPLGAYWWRVRTISSCEGPWSAAWNFGIEPMPAPPSSPSPANGASGVSINANLDWADVSGATSYDVYFGTSSTPGHVGNVAVSAYELLTLSASTKYYWQIKAEHMCGDIPGPVWSFTTGATANHPPENFNLWPDHGGRPAGRRVNFTATHRDLDGWRDLKQVLLHIGSASAKRNNCRLRYDVRQNKMYLLDNAGTAWLGGFAPGAAKVIRNRQCTLSCAKSTVVNSGRTVKVQWNLVFRTSFRGTKDSYMQATDIHGAKTALQKMGTYRVK